MFFQVLPDYRVFVFILRWCKCRTRHNLRRTDYIQICKSRSYNRRLLFFNLGREPGQFSLVLENRFYLNADVGA